MAQRYEAMAPGRKRSRNRLQDYSMLADHEITGRPQSRRTRQHMRSYGDLRDEATTELSQEWRNSFSDDGAWESAEDLTDSHAYISTVPPSMQHNMSQDLEAGVTVGSTPASRRKTLSQSAENSSFLDHSSVKKRPISTQTYQPRSRGMVVLHPMQAEPDDYLHIPDKNVDAHSYRPTWRGCVNVMTIAIIALALLMLFVGYPIIANFSGTFNKGKNSYLTDVKPQPLPIRGLIDPDTPKEAYTKKVAIDGTDWELVFSDEFEKEGRTFWPGDDPFWEGGNFYYKATFDYEWYTPEAMVTKDGKLFITIDQYNEHNTHFRSGMLQSWNKFCFQGGYIEASVILPAKPSTQGYWPGFWLMGNLGRPGFLASTDGMWPYAYESCDLGILPYQQNSDRDGPEAALHAKTFGKTHNISSLPGMRFPSCTCADQDHPGPDRKTARSAPELDIYEIQVSNGRSHASQSYQVAPFDANYKWYGNSSSYHIYDSDITKRNPWSGGETQEALSCVTRVPDSAFFGTDAKPTIIGVEYDPDFDNQGNGYITWYMDGKPSWTLYQGALSPDEKTQISWRTFPKEPMSIIINLGISSGFQDIDWDDIQFPAHLAVEHVRVYQKPGSKRVSCDPSDHPTADYIKRNQDLYYNNNLTSFLNSSHHMMWPKNDYKDGC
mgnify:FL=1